MKIHVRSVLITTPNSHSLVPHAESADPAGTVRSSNTSRRLFDKMRREKHIYVKSISVHFTVAVIEHPTDFAIKFDI